MAEFVSDYSEEVAKIGAPSAGSEQKFADIFGAERPMIATDPNEIMVLYAQKDDHCTRLVQIVNVDPPKAALLEERMQWQAARHQIDGMDPRSLSPFS